MTLNPSYIELFEHRWPGAPEYVEYMDQSTAAGNYSTEQVRVKWMVAVALLY